jgi:hypothetical protein
VKTFVSFRQWRGGIIFIRRGCVNPIHCRDDFYNEPRWQARTSAVHKCSCDKLPPMRAVGFIIGAVLFARRHLVAAACVCAFAVAMIGTAVHGNGPVPQGPPDGYSLVSGRVSLEWNRGTRPQPITLEVAEDDPSFVKPVFQKVVNGAAFTLTTVHPGKKYYWRLLQNNYTSPTASFEVSSDYADF